MNLLKEILQFDKRLYDNYKGEKFGLSTAVDKIRM